MKILHVVFSLDPGGMENGIVNLASHLPPADFTVGFACLSRPGALAARLPGRCPVRAFGRRGGFSFGAWWHLRRLLGEMRPDVLHTHNLGPLIYGALAAVGRPTTIIHGEHAELTAADLRPRRLRQRRVLYRFCRRVHVVSSGLRDQLQALGLAGQQLVTILNGVDTDRFQPAPQAAIRQRLGLAADGPLIGMVGRFGPFKRHRLALDGFAAFRAAGGRARLLLVGAGGPEEPTVRQAAAASPWRDDIHFAGFQLDPVPWYQAMDLLLIASTNEGLSNAMLEAMACGVPVLTHATCGCREVVTDGADGIIARLDDAPAVADALAAALRDPDRREQLGAAARLTVARRFSLRAMVDHYADLYRSAVAGS